MTTRAQSARSPGRGEITRVLEAMREGDPEAGEELSSRVYHELRALAASMLSHEAPSQTLQPTALVHEAWLRLAGDEGARFPDRAYFFAAAGRAMRRILVGNARRKMRLKRGGDRGNSHSAMPAAGAAGPAPVGLCRYGVDLVRCGMGAGGRPRGLAQRAGAGLEQSQMTVRRSFA